MNSKFKIQNSKTKNKGLSLIEAVVAIAILAMGLIGALALATFGIIAGGESKTRVVAINLAREGVEVVRNIRDSNWLKCGEGCWIEGETGIVDDIPIDSATVDNVIPEFNSATSPKTLCGTSVDPNSWILCGTSTTFSPSSPQTEFQIGIDDNGLYVQPAPAGKETNFYRALDIEKVNDELKVTCYVAYQERGKWHLVNVEDHLFNWY